MNQIYNEQLKMSLPPLGFGIMRLEQHTDGSFPESVYSLLNSAYEKGVRYFDTGYKYLHGRSESLLRDTFVNNGVRKEILIAGKLPIWRVATLDDAERIFDEQLSRLGTDYFDFYLLHALNKEHWDRLLRLNIEQFLERKVSSYGIKKVGFSLHDDVEALRTIDTGYDFDFVMLQINYYDWETQHARENYEYCEKKNLPVFVMEPLGGGRLSNLPEKAEKLFAKDNRSLSTVTRALHFVASLHNVAVVLSGMKNEQELSENIEAFNNIPHNIDYNLYEKVTAAIQSISTIPCTTCNYCDKECPKNVDIPLCFQKYNDYLLFGLPLQIDSFAFYYFDFVPFERQAHNCINCRKCVKRCPQNIDIPQELMKIATVAVADKLGCDIENLKEHTAGKKIVCFGAGAMGLSFIRILKSLNIDVDFICDNSSKLWGTMCGEVSIISPARLEEIKKEAVVFISSSYYSEIKEQLSDMGVMSVN